MDQRHELDIHDGQCGLCAHFDEHHATPQDEILEIRKRHKGPDDIVAECGHPNNARLHLRVNVTSGCDGFVPAAEAR